MNLMLTFQQGDAILVSVFLILIVLGGLSMFAQLSAMLDR